MTSATREQKEKELAKAIKDLEKKKRQLAKPKANDVGEKLFQELVAEAEREGRAEKLQGSIESFHRSMREERRRPLNLP